MQCFNFSSNNKSVILALGAESAGNFSAYNKGKIYFSADFGDLLIDTNWSKYKKELNKFLRENKIKPEIILTDLHPLYKTTALGQELAKKYKARHVQVQHHTAHIFSCIGENMSISNFQFPISKQIQNSKFNPPAGGQNSAIGIALDGTGYGLDGNIWGGEAFEVKSQKSKVKSIERIGKLENQIMIGGDLAIKEPARMLITTLSKFLPKDTVYKHIKKYYTRNQFEVLYNQLQSRFNCQETSSTGRVLDAVSIFLGFCENERNFKHEPALRLEQNSTLPYRDLKPKLKIKNPRQIQNCYELDTTYLFKYLHKYLHRDKKRLAATAQLYLAQGLYEIIEACHPELVSGSTKKIPGQARNDIFLAGGIANNKIISDYLISKGAIVNKKIPRGDAGISFGQIICYLANPRD